MRRFGFVFALTLVLMGALAGTAFAQGGGRGGPGGGGGGVRRPDACAALAKAVHEACPCNGVDGAGWADHAAYVTCVTDAANAAVAAGGLQVCADKAIERAEKSPIGTEGFVCPTAPRGPGRPGEPGKPGEPRRPGEPGEPRAPRPSDACVAVAKAVHDACPCNGVDGAGWADHAAYVTCVTDAANAAVAAGADQACADKAIERADKSPIGTEGFVCPTEGGRGRRGPGGGR